MSLQKNDATSVSLIPKIKGQECLETIYACMLSKNSRVLSKSLFINLLISVLFHRFINHDSYYNCISLLLKTLVTRLQLYKYNYARSLLLLLLNASLIAHQFFVCDNAADLKCWQQAKNATLFPAAHHHLASILSSFISNLKLYSAHSQIDT